MKVRTRAKKHPETETVTHGSGNVLADLGFAAKEAAELKVKADLTLQIHQRIKKLGLTQVRAAERLRLSQPDVSKLMSGRHSGYSIERMWISSSGPSVTAVGFTPVPFVSCKLPRHNPPTVFLGANTAGVARWQQEGREPQTRFYRKLIERADHFRVFLKDNAHANSGTSTRNRRGHSSASANRRRPGCVITGVQREAGR
jgi:predicted XRE-type DNA-binding protein